MMAVETQNMGIGTEAVFRGEGSEKAIQEAYAESPRFFAEQIRKQLPEVDVAYSLGDIGTHKGDFLKKLLQELPEYTFDTVGIDINAEALGENKTANRSIIASIDTLPLPDRSIDILTARYTIQWNSREQQKKILAELARVASKFILLEHPGPDSDNPLPWRTATDDIFTGQDITKLKRDAHFYASSREVEQWLQEAGIAFEKLRERRIEGLADIWTARYALDSAESDLLTRKLGPNNYIIQTDWILRPKA